MPMTMEGTPFSRSTINRMVKAKLLLLYSARKIPASEPMGTPIKTARRRTLPLPTMALAMPPPVSPDGFGSWVKNAQLSDLAPCTNR